jgi:hypothetical protein
MRLEMLTGQEWDWSLRGNRPEPQDFNESEEAGSFA